MNAVLRNAQANSAKFGMLSDDLLIPDTFGDTWLEAYGEDAIDGFSDALLAGAPLDLTLKNDDADLIDALGAEPVMADTVRIDQRDRPVEALPGYAEGRWWVQDAASAIPARLLGAKPGGRVLDLCAAPGGKTAQLVKAGYQVTALDSDANRMERLKENLARLDYAAETVVADAGTYAPDSPYRRRAARRALLGHRHLPPPPRSDLASLGRRRRRPGAAAAGAADQCLPLP